MNTTYYIGLGSNIDPEKNLPRMVDCLKKIDPDLKISPSILTQAIDIHSQNPFLNAVAIVHTALDEKTLKEKLNSFEKELGRNRAHPDRKKLDRTADFDILGTQETRSQWEPVLPDYLKQPLSKISP